MITITPVNFNSYKSNNAVSSKGLSTTLKKAIGIPLSSVERIVENAKAIDPKLGELLNNLRGGNVSFVVRNCIPEFMTYFESATNKKAAAIKVSKEFLEEMKKERIHHNLIDGIKKINEQGELTGEVYTGLEKAIQIISSR